MSTAPQVVWDQVAWDDPLGEQARKAARTAGAPEFSPAPSETLQSRMEIAARSSGVPTLSTPPGARDIAAAGDKIDRLAYLQSRALRSPTPVSDAAMTLMPAAGLAEMGVKPALSTLGRGLLKSAAGSTVGSALGYGLGEAVGQPDRGAQVGATIGGLTGPLVPNRMWASTPYGLNRLFLSNEDLAAERTAMKLAQRASDETAGIRKIPDELTQAVREGRAARLPTRMRIPERPAASPLAGLPSTSLGDIRDLPALPEGSPAGAGPTTGTNSRYQLAGPLTLARPGAGLEPNSDVLRIPEPRPLQPTDRPGAMFSVPREQLPGLAAQGTPGAGDVLRNTGKTVLYEPPSGYPGPRGAEGATRLALPAAPSMDTLADAMVQRGGMDRPSAERRAEELLNAISGKNFTSAERASARNQIRSLIGGE